MSETYEWALRTYINHSHGMSGEVREALAVHLRKAVLDVPAPSPADLDTWGQARCLSWVRRYLDEGVRRWASTCGYPEALPLAVAGLQAAEGSYGQGRLIPPPA